MGWNFCLASGRIGNVATSEPLVTADLIKGTFKTMPTPSAPLKTPPPPREFSFLAMLLSYVLPGLGQIYQGRVAKGLLFFFCLHGLFFYGMYLGDWANVYLPDSPPNPKPWNLPDLVVNLYNRPQFAGQFWIGMAAWPAIWQYNHWVPVTLENPFWRNFERTPPERAGMAPPGWEGKSLNDLQTEGDKTWDLGWVYTVIAGVLNVLVIYDAAAGPAFGPEAEGEESKTEEDTRA
jgi:hypothetical protein